MNSLEEAQGQGMKLTIIRPAFGPRQEVSVGNFFHLPRENVCGLRDVFIWRAERSSRTSRDLEKVFSRLGEVGLGAGFSVLSRTWCSVSGKTGTKDVAADLVVGFFMD
jgi:hypothetical protein